MGQSEYNPEASAEVDQGTESESSDSEEQSGDTATSENLPDVTPVYVSPLTETQTLGSNVNDAVFRTNANFIQNLANF